MIKPIIGQRWAVYSDIRREWAEAEIVDLNGAQVTLKLNTHHSVPALTEKRQTELSVLLFSPRKYKFLSEPDEKR